MNPIIALFSVVSLGLACLFLDERLTSLQILIISVTLIVVVITVFKLGKLNFVDSRFPIGIMVGFFAASIIGAHFFTRRNIKTNKLLSLGLLPNDVFCIGIHSNIVLKRGNGLAKVEL